MTLSRVLKPYLQVYHFMGVIDHPYGSHRLLRKIPASIIGLFLLLTQLTGLHEIIILMRSEWDVSDRLLLGMIAALGFIQVVLTLSLSVFQRQVIFEAQRIFLAVEDIFQKDLHWPQISYVQFKRGLHLCFFLLVFSWLQAVSFYALYNSFHLVTVSDYAKKVLHLFWTVLISCFVLHSGTVTFFLNLLNSTIERDLKEFGYYNNNKIVVRNNAVVRSIKYKIRKYKLIHFHLWQSVQHISAYFGWLFIPIFLNFFMTIFYSTYWIAQVYRRRRSFEELLRE